jgi:hypothetical protein
MPFQERRQVVEVPNHIVCNVCGLAKGETNHWLKCITIPPTAEAPGLEGIAFALIDAPVYDPDIKIEHLCGQGCAHKRLSQWLDDLTAMERQTA